MIKQILSLLLFMPILSFSAGGVWVMEIEFEYNGHVQHGYVQGDYWTNDFDKYIERPKHFQRTIDSLMKAWDQKHLIVFSQLHDQEVIANKASFPMHPFFLINGSEDTLEYKHISNLKLVKVWQKIDYTINVLTMLSLADTLWIGETALKTHPIGEDVGCRLEVHNFDHTEGANYLVKEFSKLYLRKDSLTKQEVLRYSEILAILKKEHIVVVELCGC